MCVPFMLQWRRFNFFDKDVVKDPHDNKVFEGLKGIDISACVSGRGQVVIGDHNGNLTLVNRQLQVTSFGGYKVRVSHLHQMRQHNLLVSVGEDDIGINPCIKVWNFDKKEKGIPYLASVMTKAIPDNKPVPVTCLTIHENLNLMALGYTNGSVVLHKGDIARLRHIKTKVIHEAQKPITGLHFKTTGRHILFITTEDSICSIDVDAKVEGKNDLEQFGGKLKCSVLSDAIHDTQLVVGRHDAVYFFQPDGRGQCLVFEGQKLSLHWYRGYLVVVGKDTKALPSHTSNYEMNIVTVYDIQNKLIAYSAPFPEVIDVFGEWGSLYILSADGKVYQLEEKDTQTKLAMLFKKSMYMLAINLAKSQQYDEEGLTEIFTQYGDHLYSKGDYEGAIDQYIKTIGNLEPSYVIRKFLDAHRIHNLTMYLQVLLKTKDREVDFDVETAIKVCRQAGYHSHALILAELHNKHEWYLKIQLENVKDYHKALEYIGKLEFFEAEVNMKRYGKMLMAKVPVQTTDLLKRLCTNYLPTDRPIIDQTMLEGGVAKVDKAAADGFIHIFVNNSQKLTEFLEHMIKVQPNSPSIVYNTVLELYLQQLAHETSTNSRVEKQRKTLDLLQNPEAGYDLDQAMVLCQMNNFKAGILYLYEKAQLYHQILRYHMDHNEYTNVIDACKRFGPQDSTLWVQALSYFAKKEDDCKAQLLEVLSHIDRQQLLPPLLVIQTLSHNSTVTLSVVKYIPTMLHLDRQQLLPTLLVIQTLSHNSTVTLSVVKDYIVRRLQMENDQIAEDERLIKQYREDTERKRAHINQLKTSAKIFQASKCSLCNHSLELPSVHFLCEPHSYHLHCIEYTENENECPACLPENRKIQDIIAAQDQNKVLHEAFHSQLERAKDGFSVVADYFGRGVFNKMTLVTEASMRQVRMQAIREQADREQPKP